MEPAVTTSSPRSALAEGNINGSDRIVVELLTPTDAPQMIMIRWPAAPTVVPPGRYADCASAAMKLLASANVDLTRRRATGEL
jgi:hypothetical protein